MISEPMALNHFWNGGVCMTHAHFSGRPQHLAKHHEVDMDIPKHLQSSQPLCRPNPILYPDCPTQTVGLHCISNCHRTSPSMKQCVLFTIRTPYVLVSPFVYRPSLSHIMLGTDIHPIPMSFLSGLIYTAKSDHKSELSSQAHHPSAHISLPTLVGICAHLLKSWSLERTWINIRVGYFW